MKQTFALAGAGLIALQTTAFAQAVDITTDDSQVQILLEEIIVNARRLEESVQDVPISITTFSGQDFVDKGLFSFNDVGDVTAGVSIVGEGGGTNFVSIRGVGNLGTASPLAPATTLFIDEAPAIDTALLINSALDIASLEILRGPQGTLYGTNATAGAINIYTRDPGLNGKYNGYLETTYSFYDVNDNNTYEIEGAVDVPMIKDVLGVRLALSTRRDEGYINNPFTGDSAQETKLNNFRAKTLWLPNDDVEVRFTLGYVDGESQQPFGINIPAETGGSGNPAIFDKLDFDDFETSQTVKPTDEDQLFSIINIKWDTAIGQLTAITSYQDRTVGFNRDLDGSSTFDDTISFEFEAEQFTQEVRLAGDVMDERVEFLVGAYYSDRESQTGQIIDLTSSDALPFVINDDKGESTSSSVALFTNNTINITDKFSLAIGARYDVSKLDVDDEFVDLPLSLLSQTLGGPLITGTFKDKKDETNWAASIKANYYISHNVLLYAAYDRAFRQGSFNGSAPQPALAEGFGEFDRETSNAYEIGFKSDGWLNNRLRINGAIYYQTFKDYQYQQFDITTFVDITASVRDIIEQDRGLPPGTLEALGFPSTNGAFIELGGLGLVMNAPKVSNMGAELEAAFQMNEHWFFSAAISTNELEFDEFTNVPTSASLAEPRVLPDQVLSGLNLGPVYAGNNAQTMLNFITGGVANVTGTVVNSNFLPRRDLSGDHAGFYSEAIPLSATLTAEYRDDLQVFGGSEWFARIVYAFNEVSAITSPTLAEDMSEFDFFIGMNSQDYSWTVQLFITNVTDEVVIAPNNIITDADAPTGPVGLPNAPREIGITFRQQF